MIGVVPHETLSTVVVTVADESTGTGHACTVAPVGSVVMVTRSDTDAHNASSPESFAIWRAMCVCICERARYVASNGECLVH